MRDENKSTSDAVNDYTIDLSQHNITYDPYALMNVYNSNMSSTGGGTGIYTSSTSGTGVYTVSGAVNNIVNTTGTYSSGSWANSATNGVHTATGFGYSPSITVGTGRFGDNDITLTRGNKPPLKIGATLDMIMEALYIVVPDDVEHDKNPALKSAYEEWQRQFREQTERMHSLKEAYESYNMMKKLCREDEE